MCPYRNSPPFNFYLFMLSPTKLSFCPNMKGHDTKTTIVNNVARSQNQLYFMNAPFFIFNNFCLFFNHDLLYPSWRLMIFLCLLCPALLLKY